MREFVNPSRLPKCVQFLLIAALSATALASPSFSLTLSPRVGFRPLTVQAQLRIEPDYQNVGWCLQWFQKGQEFPDGRHCEQLNGQYERRLHFYTIKALNTGEYDVSATLLRTHTFQLLPVQPIRVLDSPF